MGEITSNVPHSPNAFYKSPHFEKRMACFRGINLLRLDWSKILIIEAYRFDNHPLWKLYRLGNPRLWLEAIGMIRYFIRELLWHRESFLENESWQESGIDFLMLKSLQRPDFNVFFESVRTTLPPAKSHHVVDIREPIRGFNSSAAILFVRHLPVFARLTVQLGAFEATYCYCKVVRYLTVVKRLEKIRPRNVVVFADMQPIDNAVAQFFKLKQIPVITLQHGLYVEYDSMDTINRVNYENVVSDHFLAWGTPTAQLIHKYQPSVAVSCCGNPSMKPLPLRPGQSDFFVFLDQKLFEAQNQQLLNVAADFARKTGRIGFVQVHPADNWTNYKADSEWLRLAQTSWHSFSIALGHTSTILYEALRLGVVVFQLESDAPCHRLPAQFRFASGDDLLKKYQNHPDPAPVGEHFICQIGEASSKLYQEFFKSL